MTEDSTNQASAGRDVFVSYASQDAAVANSVVEALERQGIKCWIAPRDVTPGSQYADAIVGAINDAKVLVMVLSLSAVASPHVGREVERAASKQRRIIAFRTDSAPLTRALEYFLSESQWIDVPALGLPAALAKLTQAVGQVLASPSTPSPEPGAGISTSGQPMAVRSTRIGKRLALAAAAVVMCVVVVGLAVHFWSTKGQAPAVAASSDKSIAVLPFADMSQKKDQEYFGDGMAEEILDLLAKIPGLTVIGRTSSFQFKGKNEDLRKIGTELNAAYVLEGSVRSSGDQVRITAQLINTKTGAHEWSETYDRPIGDVLKLQDAIAAAVVRELQLAVDADLLNSQSTVRSTEAYNLYLRGRHAADRWDKEGFDEAVTLFQEALDRDATFADAAAELALAYEWQGEEDYVTPATAFEQARRAAATALSQNPKSARAHFAAGLIHVNYDWDWPRAEREFQQVAALAPGSADALIGEEALSLVFGRWEDGLRQIKTALAQDPLRATSYYHLAEIQMRRGHLADAEVAIRRGLDIRPTYEWGHWLLGLVLLARADHESALLEMQGVTVDDGWQAGLAMVYYALGRKADSDAALALMLAHHADDDAFEIANVYAFRGQPDEAMHWLERAYAQKDAGLIYVKAELPLKNIEGDARYKAFLKKMNLPE
jgi:TolB-like protein